MALILGDTGFELPDWAQQLVVERELYLASIEEITAPIWAPWYRGYQLMNPHFIKLMKEVQAALGKPPGEIYWRAKPKRPLRIIELALQLADGDDLVDGLRNVRDVIGATIIVSSQHEIDMVAPVLEEAFEVPKMNWEVKDTRISPLPSGYRDLKWRIPMLDETWVEIILITPEMGKAKMVNHRIYEFARSAEAILKDHPSEALAIQLATAYDAMRCAFESAWALDIPSARSNANLDIEST